MIKNNYNIYISRANECSVDAFVVAKFDVEIRELLGEFWLRKIKMGIEPRTFSTKVIQ